MNDYLIPLHVLFTTAAFSMIFVLVISTSPNHRNASFYIFLLCLIFTALGYLTRGGILAVDLVDLRHPAGRIQANRSIPFVLCNVIIGISVFFRVLLIRSLFGNSVIWWRALIVFFVILLLSILPTRLLDQSPDSRNYYFIATTFYLCCAGLIIFTFHRARKQSEMFMWRLVYVLSIVIFFINCVGLVVFFYVLRNVDFFDANLINNFDTWLRSIRVSLFFCIDIGLLYFWLQNHSTGALHAADDRSRIEALLIEKEMLIRNLMDADALVHTGALAGGVSHELNQFLARIQLDAESARSYALANESPDKIVRTLNRLTSANQEAAKLILSLKKLFVKRTDDRTRCDLDPLVESVVTLYANRIKQSGIEFECVARTGATAILDDSLIRRVVSNLLANALDACAATGRKDLKVNVTSQVEGGSWVFSISDNATGIHPSVAHKVFGLFATTKSDGTGIGLWLSQHIIEIHAGSIKFENLDTGGVKFSFRIPLGHTSISSNSLPSFSAST